MMTADTRQINTKFVVSTVEIAQLSQAQPRKFKTIHLGLFGLINDDNIIMWLIKYHSFAFINPPLGLGKVLKIKQALCQVLYNLF